ncbi:MAG: hypothetical protein ACUVR8_13130 [Acidobacteriota bacterium]
MPALRRKLVVPVKVSGADANGQTFEQTTETVDVSGSGTCVRLARLVSIASRLSVWVPSCGWQGQAIVRKMSLDVNGYLDGIEIIELGPAW